MQAIALLPLIAGVIWIAMRSHREAFLDIYLFSLLLLPAWCRVIIPGLPDPTFCEAAVLPVALAFLLKRWRQWPFSAMDALVFSMIGLICWSEYQNAGYAEAQNLMFDMLASGLLPYVLGKGILDTPEIRVRFMRRFVGYLSVVVVFFLYEFRFRFNPYRRMFDPFFPGQGWITTERFGFARAAGPYSHALLAGAILMIGLLLQVWLHRSGGWEPFFRRLRYPLLGKARLLTAAVSLGLLLTLARGPQLGACIAAVFVWIGAGKQPRQRLLVACAVLLVVGLPLAVQTYSYASVGRANAVTASQETAAYRKELLDHYVSVAMQHAMLGWGRNGWPKDPGMPSIDNYYLLLALMHGVVVSALFLTILIVLTVRLTRDGLRRQRARGRIPSLSFCLAGVFAGLLFAWFTVFLGETAMPIFFLITGFAERYLISGGDSTLAPASASEQAAPAAPRFAVVLA